MVAIRRSHELDPSTFELASLECRFANVTDNL